MSRNYFQHSTNFKTLNGLRGGTSEQRFDTSLLPSVSETYDLGSGTLKWQELYVNKVDALGGESRFTSVDVTDTMRTNDLVVTGTTTYSLLAANDADIAALKVTNVNARTVGGEILVGDDMRLGADEILYTNKIRSNPAGGTVTVYDNLTVLGTLNYTLPPAPSAVFGTLGDTEIGDLVTDPLDASPPEAADSNLQPAAERVLSAPTINATQWISTPFLTLMGLAQTDKLKVTSDKIPTSKTDYNNSAFWNEGGAILQGRTYIDAECIPNSLSVVGNATVGGTLGVTGATTLSSTLGVTGATTLGGNTRINGNVGINTDPAANTHVLQINGDVKSSKGGVNTMIIESTTASTAQLQFNDNSTSRNAFYTFGSSDKFGLYCATPNTTLLCVDNATASIGIGTTTPGRKFDVNGIARATQMEIEASGSTLLVTPRKRQAADADGWVTLDPNGGDNSVDNTGVYVWGSFDVEGNFKSRKTGPASSVTVGPNTFAGGISVNDTSVMRNLTFTNAAGTFMNVAVGQKGGVPTAGWVSLDPNGGGANSGVFFYDLTEFSGRSTFLDGVTSTLSGNATSTTAGPNIFSGGLAVNGTSHMSNVVITSSLTLPSSLTFPPSSVVTVPNLRTTDFSVNRLTNGSISGSNQQLSEPYFAPNTVITRIGLGSYEDTTVSAGAIISQLEAYGLTDSRMTYFFYMKNDATGAWKVTWGSGITSGRSSITLASGAAIAVQVIRSNSSSALNFRLGNLSEISPYASYDNYLWRSFRYEETNSGAIEYPADYCNVNSVVIRSGGGTITDTLPSAASIIAALQAKLGGGVTLSVDTTWTFVMVNNRTGPILLSTYEDTTIQPSGFQLNSGLARVFRVIVDSPTTPTVTIVAGAA